MHKKKLSLGVSYFGNRFLSHAKRDIAEIAEACDYVVLPFSETDLLFHKSAYENIVKESHKKGLTVWADPWALGGVFGGETFSRFLLEHRKAWQFLSDGRSVPVACLNNEEFKKYTALWIKTVRDLGVDTVFWDEPHYYVDINLELKGIYSCTCWACRDKFYQIHHETMPAKLNLKVKEFRLQALKNFLDEQMGYSKKLGMQNALTIYAIKGFKEYDLIWNEAVALKHVDIFGCDPYWRWHLKREPKKYVGYFAKKTLLSADANNKQAQIWIQTMKIPKNREYEIEKAIISAYDCGIRNIAAWSYDGGEILDGLYSPNYKLVWKTAKKTFMKLRKMK